MYVYAVYISVQNFTFKFQAAAEKTAKNSRGYSFMHILLFNIWTFYVNQLYYRLYVTTVRGYWLTAFEAFRKFCITFTPGFYHGQLPPGGKFWHVRKFHSGDKFTGYMVPGCNS